MGKATITPESAYARVDPVVAKIAARQHSSPDDVRRQILLAATETNLDEALLGQGDVLAQVRKALAEGDADNLTAWLASALRHDPRILRRPKVKEGKLKKDATGRLARPDQNGKRILVLDPVPLPVAPGKDAHRRLRDVYEAKGEIGKVLARNTSFRKGSDGQVTRAEFTVEEKSVAGTQMTLLPGVVASVKNETVQVKKQVWFSHSLPGGEPFEMETDKVGWGLKSLRTAWDNLLVACDQKLPLNPADALTMQRDVATRRQLVEVVELVQALLPGDNLAEIIEKIPESGGQFRFKTQSPLRIINLLSVGKAILEISSQESRDGKVGVLGELSLGVINMDGAEITAGFPDLVELECPAYSVESFGVNFAGLVSDCESRCQSRANRHVRIRANDEGKTEQVYPTRDLNSIIEQLVLRLGPDVLNQLQVTIRDHKFIVGDGGLDKFLDTTQLPASEHNEQIDDYLVAIACTLCLADKKSRWAAENSVVSDEDKVFSPKLSSQELVEYIQKSELFRRVKGIINYPTPSGIKEYLRQIPSDPTKLQNWIEEFMGRRRKATRNWEALAVYSALKWLTDDRADSVETERREVVPVPGELGKVCVEFAGRHYLGLEELRDVLFDPLARIHTTVHIRRPDIKLLVFEGLDDEKGRYRLTIRSSTGRFNLCRIKTEQIPIIQGGKIIGHANQDLVDPTCAVTGILCHSFREAGLVGLANTKLTVEKFNKFVWEIQLRIGGREHQIVTNTQSYGQFYDAVGNLLNFTHEGAYMWPKYDAMTGRRYIQLVSQEELDLIAKAAEKRRAVESLEEFDAMMEVMSNLVTDDSDL